MANNYKAVVFFDLDGTLLNNHSKLDIGTLISLKILQKNNVLPIITTGRTLSESQSIMNQTGINSIVAMNGQVILIEGKLIYQNLIPVPTCKKFMELAQVYREPIALYSYNNSKLTFHNTTVSYCYDLMSAKIPEILINNDPILSKTNMILLLTEDDEEKYFSEFPNLTFYRNTPFSVDIIHNNASKGTALSKITSFLEQKNVDTYAFGDGKNDLDLFKNCKYAIAMGNACNELKEYSTYVTNDNNEYGIVEGLRYYSLI